MLGPIAQLGERLNGIEKVMSSSLFRSISLNAPTNSGHFVFYSKGNGLTYRKVVTVTKKEQTIWDDLLELGREILQKIDELFQPDKKRIPARVPVPIRELPQQDPYSDMY